MLPFGIARLTPELEARRQNLLSKVEARKEELWMTLLGWNNIKLNDPIIITHFEQVFDCCTQQVAAYEEHSFIKGNVVDYEQKLVSVHKTERVIDGYGKAVIIPWSSKTDIIQLPLRNYKDFKINREGEIVLNDQTESSSNQYRYHIESDVASKNTETNLKMFDESQECRGDTCTFDETNFKGHVHVPPHLLHINAQTPNVDSQNLAESEVIEEDDSAGLRNIIQNSQNEGEQTSQHAAHSGEDGKSEDAAEESAELEIAEKDKKSAENVLTDIPTETDEAADQKESSKNVVPKSESTSEIEPTISEQNLRKQGELVGLEYDQTGDETKSEICSTSQNLTEEERKAAKKLAKSRANRDRKKAKKTQGEAKEEEHNVPEVENKEENSDDEVIIRKPVKQMVYDIRAEILYLERSSVLQLEADCHVSKKKTLQYIWSRSTTENTQKLNDALSTLVNNLFETSKRVSVFRENYLHMQQIINTENFLEREQVVLTYFYQKVLKNQNVDYDFSLRHSAIMADIQRPEKDVIESLKVLFFKRWFADRYRYYQKNHHVFQNMKMFDVMSKIVPIVDLPEVFTKFITKSFKTTAIIDAQEREEELRILSDFKAFFFGSDVANNSQRGENVENHDPSVYLEEDASTSKNVRSK